MDIQVGNRIYMLTIPNFSESKVLVIGDIMLDRQWTGETARISPEAPVPVVNINQCDDRPGGAGNVALNIRALGGAVPLIGLRGEDEAGDKLAHKLQAATIDSHLVSTKQPTVTKLRVMSQHQQLIRLDFEEIFAEDHQEELLEQFTQQLSNVDAVILSDYGKGTLNDPQPFIQAARKAKVPLLVDPKGKDFKRYHGATLLTPNRKEFEIVVGHCKDEQQLVEKGLDAIRKHDLQAMLITRGSEGMTLLQPNEPECHLPAKARDVYDVTGAGDTVIGTIAASLAAGETLKNSVTLANIAAGIVVTKLGTATISVQELTRAARKFLATPSGVVNQAQCHIACEQAKLAGEKIVFTNGCFDILHAGHVAYLAEARALGDRLIVAVNDDDSVRQLKGKDRPINPLMQRMLVLAGLNATDWVVPFSEDTPEALIATLLPDVLVKGGDYKVEQIAGHKQVLANGGEVKILQFVEGVSTTNTVNKIRQGEKP